MGVVYQAEDTLLKRQVAIKILPKEVAANSESLKRFRRESQGAARLNHPNVVAVYDVGEVDGTHYIVMELVQGGSAQDFLTSRGPIHWTEATSILCDVCRGVEAAHKAGLIHRDIKPANILRSTEGVVKLADFGLVKPAGRKGTVVTTLGGIVGTPHYMSPEQSQSGTVDERSDVYSLGATADSSRDTQPPSFVWSSETSSPVSLAERYPGEQTEAVRPPRDSRRKLLGLGLLGLLLGGVVVSYILGRAAPAPVVSEDWPALAAAAENAIRQRSVPAMKSVRERRLATKPSPGACRCVAFARQGALLASGSGSNLCLWNADTQELLATLRGHGQDITSLAFSSEGGILASGSNDQTLRLWDVTRFLPSSPP